MIEPKNYVICPQCYRPEVHFNSKNGFYCMACGRKFSSKETRVLVEHEIFQIGAENSFLSSTPQIGEKVSITPI